MTGYGKRDKDDPIFKKNYLHADLIEPILHDLEFNIITLDFGGGQVGRELVLHGLMDEPTYRQFLDDGNDLEFAAKWLHSFQLTKMLSLPENWFGFIESFKRSGYQTLAEVLQARLHPDDVDPADFTRRVQRALDKYKTIIESLDYSSGKLALEMYLAELFDEATFNAFNHKRNSMSPEQQAAIFDKWFTNGLYKTPKSSNWHDFIAALQRSNNITLAERLMEWFYK